METERLVQVKRLLYVEGIGANIDAGTWDKLGPGQQLGSFGHVLMWRRPAGSGDLILARLWSSSDGKGRTRYPMVVCAQLRGVSLRWALENVLPEFERLETACKATASAPEVVRLIDDSRAALRGRAARAEQARAEVVLEPETFADLVGRPELGPDRQGLLRVLYQSQREMGAFARDSALIAGSIKGKSPSPRPQHLRVPACSPTPAGAISAWTQFMLTLIEPQHPMMVIVPLPEVVRAEGVDGGWADIIIGEAGAAQLMCIRATPKGLPLTTEIPYSIDAAFVTLVDRWAETVMGGVDGGPGGRVLAELPPRERKGASGYPGASASAKAAARKGLPIALIIGVLIALGLAAAVVVAMLMTGEKIAPHAPANTGTPNAAPASPSPVSPTSDNGGDTNTKGAAPVSAATNAAPASAPATDQPGTAGGAQPAPEAVVFDAAAWRSLCEAYRDWMSGFLNRLAEPAPAALYAAREGSLPPDATRLDAYLAEDGLRDLVRPMVDAGMIGKGSAGANGGLDPWGIAGAPRSRDLGSLTRAPGDAVKTTAAADKIARAVAIVTGFRNGITAWTAPALLNDQAAKYRALSWNGAADEAANAAKGASIRDGQDIAAGIDAAIVAAAKVRRIEGILASCRSISTRGTQMNDAVIPSLSTWAESLPAASRSTATLDAIINALQPADGIAARLSTFLDSEYPGVDAQAFHASEQYGVLAAVASGKSNGASGTGGTGGAAGRLDVATFDQWVYRARAFPSLDPTLDPRKSWEPGATIEAIAAGVRTLEQPPLAAPLDEATKTQIEHSAAEVEAVQALPWNVSTRSEVESRTRSADESLRQARMLVDRKLAAARERLGASDAEVRESLAAREKIVASDAVNAAWRGWRDTLLKQYTPEQYQELSKAAADLRESLVQFDEQAVPPAKLENASGEWAPALAASLATEREAIIAEAMKTLDATSLPTQEAMTKLGEGARAKFAASLAAAEQLSIAAKSVSALLSAGYTLDEPAASDAAPGSPRTLSEFVRDHRAEVDAGGLGPLGARLVELQHAESETDPAKLSRLIFEPTPGRPELAVAAWRKLVATSGGGAGAGGGASAPLWPASIDDAQQCSRMQAALAVPIGDIADQRRRETLSAEVAKGQSALWLAWAQRASEADVEKTAALAPAMGVTSETMPGWMRYNTRLIALRTDLAAAGADEPKARAAAEKFVADVAQMPAPIAQSEPAAALLGVLKPALAGEESKESAVDPLTLGPGALAGAGKPGGFTGSSPDNGATLVFTGPRGLSLRFVRVEPSQGGGNDAGGEGAGSTFYLSQTELSVGQTSALLEVCASTDDRRRVLERLGQISEVSQGVRTWIVAGSSFAPAPTWLPKVAGVSDATLYPDGKRPGPPSEDSPMQQVPPDVALWLARLAGCRLPTRGEWNAAWTKFGASASAQNWNIRDQTVAREDAHIATIENKHAGTPRPDSGIFVPSGQGHEGVELGSDAQSAGWDDGFLWFADVAAGVKGSVVGGDGTYHLMGNVAEYLLDNSGGTAAPSSRLADAEIAIREAAGHESIWIVGQSALLDRRETGVTPAPVTVDGSVDGFADVGLRLAFAADGSRMAARPLAERLADSARAAHLLTAR